MNNKKKLSSNLTFFYKLILPVLMIGFIVFVNITFSSSDISGILAVNSILIVFFIISYLPLINIKKVEYTKTRLIVSNYRKETNYLLKDVKDINAGFFFFYNIIIETNKGRIKIRYLVPAKERTLFPFKMVESARKFECIINK